MHNLYLSRAAVACFEGEGADAGAAGAGAAPGATPGEARFTQEDLNRYLAEDKRKHQAQLQRVEKMLEDVSASKNLSAQEREQAGQELEKLRNESRTKEQQQAHEKKQLEERYKKQLADEKKAREEWEKRCLDGVVEQGLLSAAIQGEAYNPEIMATVLRPMTRAEEVVDPKTGKGSGKFRAVVDLPDTDPNTGEKLVVTHTPASAVKRMKELPQIYGSLFKANVVSGLGSSSGTGLSNGKIDPRKLTQEQYLKIRAENPALLGLRPQKGKR
jgi:hypothetical protein